MQIDAGEYQDWLRKSSSNAYCASTSLRIVEEEPVAEPEVEAEVEAESSVPVNERAERIFEAIANFPMPEEDASYWSRGGKPNLQKLRVVTGLDVSAAERDEAWGSRNDSDSPSPS